MPFEAPIPATDQSCIHPGLVLHAYQSEQLLTFPDMLGLGASHDGHPRYSSITSYVSARWSPSFTAYDNAALWQAAMTFGVLEAITDLNIPEALLLEKRPDGTVVFTCRNIDVVVYHGLIGFSADLEPYLRTAAETSILTLAICIACQSRCILIGWTMSRMFYMLLKPSAVLRMCANMRS